MAAGSKSALIFTEYKGGSFCPIQFNGDWRVVTMCTFDAEGPGDRLILLGCSDSFIRGVSDLYFSDDGLPILAELKLGPIRIGLSETTLVTQVQTILGDQFSGGIDSDWYVNMTIQGANDASDAIDNPRVSRTAVFTKPRRQINQGFRIRARDLVAVFTCDQLDKYAAIEQVYSIVQDGGQVR